MKERWARLTERHAWLGVVDSSARNFDKHGMSTYSAAFAFYAFLSVFPLAMVALAVLGFVFGGRPDLQAKAINTVFTSLPKFGTAFQEAMNGVIANRVSLGIVGFIGLLWSGTGFTRALDGGFSVIWERKPGRFWVWRLRGLAVILAILLVGVLGFLVNGLVPLVSSLTVLRVAIQIVLALAVNWALFMAIYVIVPRRRIHFKQVMVGALVAAVLWYGTQTALQYYVGTLANANQIYGILGAALSLLLWLYAGGLIIFYGGELNRSLYEKAGKSF